MAWKITLAVLLLLGGFLLLIGSGAFDSEWSRGLTDDLLTEVGSCQVVVSNEASGGGLFHVTLDLRNESTQPARIGPVKDAVLVDPTGTRYAFHPDATARTLAPHATAALDLAFDAPPPTRELLLKVPPSEICSTAAPADETFTIHLSGVSKWAAHHVPMRLDDMHVTSSAPARTTRPSKASRGGDHRGHATEE